MVEERFFRCLKAILIGGFWGALIVILIRLAFRSNIGVADGIAGVMAGAVVGLIPVAFLPHGFPLPRDITTLFHQGFALYFLWIVTDALMQGKFANFPRKNYLPAKIDPPTSWSEEPTAFVLLILVFSFVGVFTASVPVFYFLKAIRNTSGPCFVTAARGTNASTDV